jgi:hypothetical protein
MGTEELEPADFSNLGDQCHVILSERTNRRKDAGHERISLHSG